MEHAFNTNIAAKYDVNIAVLLHFFKCASDFNTPRSNWVEITPEYLDSSLYFWPTKKISLLINELIKLNLLERQKNTLCMYSLTTSALALYQIQERVI
jgi:hypothetical protein